MIINTHLAYSALILAVSQQLLSVLSSVNEHQQFCHLPLNCQHPLSMSPYQTALQTVGELHWLYSEPYVEWKFSVSSYLLFFSLSHLEISVGTCLSFITRISWGFWDWLWGFCFCFVFPYLPVRTLLTACRKQNWIPLLNLFCRLFYWEATWWHQCIIALQSLEVSFWGLNWPGICPEAHMPAKQLRKFLPSPRVSELLLHLLGITILNLFSPIVFSGLGGRCFRLVGFGKVWSQQL